MTKIVEFVINDKGDIVIIKNIEEFNKRYPKLHRKIKKLNNNMLFIECDQKKIYLDFITTDDNIHILQLKDG